MAFYNLGLLPQIYHYGSHIGFSKSTKTHVALDWSDEILKIGISLLERFVNSSLESNMVYLPFNYVKCFYNFDVEIYLK